MNVAFVITAHGYGHASREMEVLRALLTRRPDARAVVLTAAPEAVFRDYLGASPSLWCRVTVVPYRADVGLVQRDGITTDRDATLRALDAAWSVPERAELALAEALAPYEPNVVVGDVPPVAFPAAERLGVPSVAVGNFDWAFLYDAYAGRDPAFAPWAELCARWQRQATLAVRLTPGPALTSFACVVDGGVVARRPLAASSEVREKLGIPAGHRAVLVSFGGFGLADAARAIPELPGVTWVLAPPMADLGRDDTRFVRDELGIPYLSLVAACDAVFTKPGYGIVAEATAQRTRILYTDRSDFPEYPHLVRWLDDNGTAAHVAAADLGTERGAAAIGRSLDALFAMPARWPDAIGGGERVADAILSLVVT